VKRETEQHIRDHVLNPLKGDNVNSRRRSLRNQISMRRSAQKGSNNPSESQRCATSSALIYYFPLLRPIPVGCTYGYYCHSPSGNSNLCCGTTGVTYNDHATVRRCVSPVRAAVGEG